MKKSELFLFVYHEVLAITLEVSAVIRCHSLNIYKNTYH